jgi:hypothetical protein
MVRVLRHVEQWEQKAPEIIDRSFVQSLKCRVPRVTSSTSTTSSSSSVTKKAKSKSSSNSSSRAASPTVAPAHHYDDDGGPPIEYDPIALAPSAGDHGDGMIIDHDPRYAIDPLVVVADQRQRQEKKNISGNNGRQTSVNHATKTSSMRIMNTAMDDNDDVIVIDDTSKNPSKPSAMSSLPRSSTSSSSSSSLSSSSDMVPLHASQLPATMRQLPSSAHMTHMGPVANHTSVSLPPQMTNGMYQPIFTVATVGSRVSCFDIHGE